jgi:hypothetical protein
MINIEKVKPDVLVASLAEYGLKTNGDLQQQAERLQVHLKLETVVPPKYLSDECSECGGESDLRKPTCPFCGAGGVETKAAVPAPEKPPKGSKKKAQKTGDGTPAFHEAEAQEAPVESLPDAAAAVVSDPKTEVVPVAVKALDDGVAAVHKVLEAVTYSYWDLGKALQPLFEDQLWKARLGSDAKPIYKGWNQFVQSEFGISPMRSYEFMDASKYFKREDFQLIGYTKLVPLLRLPEEKRQELLAEAKKGRLPRARILEIVREEVGDARRDTGRSGGGSAAGGAAGTRRIRENAAARRESPSPDGEITAVHALGRVRVPLFRRPKSSKDEPKRADSLAHEPHGSEELPNGVLVTYKVVKESKGLALIIVRSRPPQA